MSEPPLRILLVDDHEVVRDGVKALLQATDDIIVTDEASAVTMMSSVAWSSAFTPSRTTSWSSTKRIRSGGSDMSGILADRALRESPRRTHCSPALRSPHQLGLRSP